MRNSRKVIIGLIIAVAILIIALIAAIIYIFTIQQSNKNDLLIVDTNKNSNQENSEQNTVDDEYNDFAVQTFNAIFESYKGRNTSSQIKSLLSAIDSNNTERTDDYIIELDESGIKNSRGLEENENYNVELFYDDNGYIYKIKITKITDETSNEQQITNVQEPESDIDKLAFNTQFTAYLGDITGKQVNELIEVVQNSLNTRPEHTITVSSNNLGGIDEIIETDIYTITLSYNTEGYASNINIDKKV